MKKHILSLFLLLMFFLFSFNFYNLSKNETEISEIIMSSIFSKVGIICLYFFILFSVLRFRDHLINTPFPISKINESPISASIYYSVSMFSFAYAISHIIG